MNTKIVLKIPIMINTHNWLVKPCFFPLPLVLYLNVLFLSSHSSTVFCPRRRGRRTIWIIKGAESFTEKPLLRQDVWESLAGPVGFTLSYSGITLRNAIYVEDYTFVDIPEILCLVLWCYTGLTKHSLGSFTGKQKEFPWLEEAKYFCK